MFKSRLVSDDRYLYQAVLIFSLFRKSRILKTKQTKQSYFSVFKAVQCLKRLPVKLTPAILDQACSRYTHLEFTRRPNQGTLPRPFLQSRIRLDFPRRSQDQPSKAAQCYELKLPLVSSSTTASCSLFNYCTLRPRRGKDPCISQVLGHRRGCTCDILIVSWSVFAPFPTEHLSPGGASASPILR